MFGVLIAVAVTAWYYFLSHLTLEAAFLNGVGFLWIWQLIFTGITAVCYLLVLLGFTGLATVAGGTAGRSLGGVAGFAAGGAFSVYLFARVMFTRAMLLGGTWLLTQSGTAEMTFAEFDQVKLIGGAVLLALYMVLGTLAAKSNPNNGGMTAATNQTGV